MILSGRVVCRPEVRVGAIPLDVSASFLDVSIVGRVLWVCCRRLAGLEVIRGGEEKINSLLDLHRRNSTALLTKVITDFLYIPRSKEKPVEPLRNVSEKSEINLVKKECNLAFINSRLLASGSSCEECGLIKFFPEGVALYEQPYCEPIWLCEDCYPETDVLEDD